MEEKTSSQVQKKYSSFKSNQTDNKNKRKIGKKCFICIIKKVSRKYRW